MTLWCLWSRLYPIPRGQRTWRCVCVWIDGIEDIPDPSGDYNIAKVRSRIRHKYGAISAEVEFDNEIYSSFSSSPKSLFPIEIRISERFISLILRYGHKPSY